MKLRSLSLTLVALLTLGALAPALPAAVEVISLADTPPPIAREFRSVWITTVWNINWPSKPGLPVAQQKSELIAMLDKAQKLGMNSVVLQVRPSCDAFYASPYEPWSEYLTGQMGKAPQPLYDPLAFAVAESHARGLELHAWFNPFRARVSDNVKVSANHVSKTHPEFVRSYGKFLWLDPGDVFARDYALKVILDVVKRYDIDGVQIDDYFYPSPEHDAAKKLIPFPDDVPWQRYLKAGGKMKRDEWRRENINIFIQRFYRGIKDLKPWVKFGISPPGIWRPGNPPQIKGWDPYTELNADSRKWLASGWCDYMSPQLYWPIDPPAQSFPVLLKWWEEQNLRNRHVWPGLATGNVGGKWKAEEVVRQIEITRKLDKNPGHIHFDMKSLMQNRGKINDDLAKLYAAPALVPAMPWLANIPPSQPLITTRTDKNGNLHINWRAKSAFQWVVQTRSKGQWTTRILSGDRLGEVFKAGSAAPETLAITAVNRVGVASKATIVKPAGLMK